MNSTRVDYWLEWCDHETQIPAKGHDLYKLAVRANLHDELSDEQKAFLAGLNPLNIEARYSEYKDRIYAQLSLAGVCENFLAFSKTFRLPRLRPLKFLL